MLKKSARMLISISMKTEISSLDGVDVNIETSTETELVSRSHFVTLGCEYWDIDRNRVIVNRLILFLDRQRNFSRLLFLDLELFPKQHKQYLDSVAHLVQPLMIAWVRRLLN